MWLSDSLPLFLDLRSMECACNSLARLPGLLPKLEAAPKRQLSVDLSDEEDGKTLPEVVFFFA